MKKNRYYLYFDTSSFLDWFYPKRDHHKSLLEISSLFSDQLRKQITFAVSQHTLTESYHAMLELKAINDMLQSGYTGKEVMSKLKTVTIEVPDRKKLFNDLKNFISNKKINVLDAPIAGDYNNALYLSLWLSLDTYDALHVSLVLNEQYKEQIPFFFITSDRKLYDILTQFSDLFGLYVIFPKDASKEKIIKNIEVLKNNPSIEFKSPSGIIREITDRIEEQEKEKYLPPQSESITPNNLFKLFINKKFINEKFK